jgi:hypothetical protein
MRPLVPSPVLKKKKEEKKKTSVGQQEQQTKTKALWKYTVCMPMDLGLALQFICHAMSQKTFAIVFEMRIYILVTSSVFYLHFHHTTY